MAEPVHEREAPPVIECATGVSVARVLAALDAHKAKTDALGMNRLGCKVTCVPWEDHVNATVKETLRRTGIAGAIERLARPSRARRAMNAMLALRERGVDAPLPLALVETRARVFFLYRHVEGYSLDRYINNAYWNHPDDKAGENAIAAAELAARIHGAGVAHGDFKPMNIVKSFSYGRLVPVDLDAATVGRSPPSRRARAKDLAALDAYFQVWKRRLGVRERYVAFRAYLALAPFETSPDDLLRAVLRRSRWKRARWRAAGA